MNLYAMNPDFYFWNIYDDATGTLAQVEAAEEAVEASVVEPYETSKKICKAGNLDLQSLLMLMEQLKFQTMA